MDIPRLHTDIYRSLRTGQRITIAAIVFAVVSILGATFIAIYAYNSALSNMIVVTTDGRILQADIAISSEGRKIEMRHHVERFLDMYYGYDQNNRTDRNERALWLIESGAGKKLNDYYAQTGWFNNVVRYNLSQSVEIQSIDIEGEDEPWIFSATAFVNVKREGAKPGRYRLKSRGQLINVSRDYPKNPHGLLIINYRESPLEKLQEP